jgi:hypothetical protein
MASSSFIASPAPLGPTSVDTPHTESAGSVRTDKEAVRGSGPGMARSASGGAPPPSRAPEDHF